MPTAASSTDVRLTEREDAPSPTSSLVEGLVAARRAVGDLRILLAFRRQTAAHPRRAVLVAVAFVLVSVAVAVVPAWSSGSGPGGRGLDVLVVLPTALAGFLVLTVFSAAASGGGRELVARDPASVLPISPTTDHLGALLLAPLNIAWLLQLWGLLGATSYGVGRDHLATAEVVVVLWVLAGTAAAQVLAWSLEGLRRAPHGIVGVRLATVVVIGVALGLQITDNLIAVFDQLPTRTLVVTMVGGPGWHWSLVVVTLVLTFVGCVALGAVPAHIASHRTARDELDVETGQHAARATSATERGALVRIDRASVWRAVPMRRGVAVLALGPGVVALLGDLDWASMTVLPGLVASGGALLYGVNAWCLDSRGALWRESLPVAPSAVFDARAYVLGEFLLAASLVTVLVAGLRAGMPGPTQLTALVASLLVITVQVVGAAMRWSAQRPYAVDLRSARATPAPPAMMVAYSSRLAASTTVTGLVFAGLAHAGVWPAPLLLAVPFLAWSSWRLLHARRRWSDPVDRARIVTTVAVA